MGVWGHSQNNYYLKLFRETVSVLTLFNKKSGKVLFIP